MFPLFQKHYYNAARLQADKEQLASHYRQAKQLAGGVTSLKASAEAMKQELMQLIGAAGRETEESDQLKAKLNEYSAEYGAKVQALRELKAKIDALETYMTASKDQMKKDFVRWYQYAVKFCQSAAARPAAANAGAGASAADRQLQDEIDEFYRLKRGLG